MTRNKLLATIILLALIAIPFYIMNNSSEINPFFEPFDTPHGTVPFDKIKNEHFEPAILEGIRQHDAEIKAIIDCPDAPTFSNTIIPLENSGKLLDKVNAVFGNLQSAETNDELQQLAQKLSPILSEHSNNIILNENLFKRIKAVYDNQANENLNQEQKELLAKTYDAFSRNGANLQGEAKERFRAIKQELSLLTLKFSENNLNATNEYQLNITNEKDLEGLPQTVIDAAAETAKETGTEGWVFTLQYPSMSPFMTYAKNRELRKTLYMASNTKCADGSKNDNKDIVSKIVNLRMELAQLLGYDNYAAYVLQNRMAQNYDNVNNMLQQMLVAYTPEAHKEVAEIEAIAKEEMGPDFKLMPWDFGYYSHKLKERKYNIDDELLRPYFELEQVKAGIFGLAERLYGISFKPANNIPVYHKDVTAYEVFDKDGSFLAVLYTDFHPRAGKRAGAWMTSYKEQWIDEETHENSRPHVSIVMNFTKPTADKPSLLTLYEVETFIHEFGHSLHGMFANSTYKSLSGTNVYWDFVELPSQIMENFVTEKEFLRTFAKHYQTGEAIPDELIDRIQKARNFNVAYQCLRQLSFGLLDMAWYTRNTPFSGDVEAYEKKAWKATQLLPAVDGTCMSVQFSHIFAGGYAAGYYSYKWAEILDADAFALFQETGIFNPETAASFRENILSKGSTEHPMVLYKRFRGQEPSIDAILQRDGISKTL